MALQFIPTVWAARLLTALEGALVYGQRSVANREYEGEIRKAGSTVKIASIGDVNIGTYTKDTDIDDPEILTDSEQSLSIDQAKYFNFYVDSIDRAQQNVNVLDEAMRRSAWALRSAADSYLATVMSSAVEKYAGRLVDSGPPPVSDNDVAAAAAYVRAHRKSRPDPKTRGLVRVTLPADPEARFSVRELVGRLMGRNPEHRFHFIQTHAAELDEEEIDA